MDFGTNEMFSFIEEHIVVADDCEWYEKLCTCIAKDTKNALSRWSLSSQDTEDIIQDVQISVIQNLATFCRDSKGNSPAQRNAWLKRIIRSSAIDFIRKSARSPTISLDDDTLTEPSSGADLSDQVLHRLELYEAIKDLGQLRTSPDKAMAFLLNKLAAASSGGSGNPMQLSEKLNGRPLHFVFQEIQIQLSSLLGAPVPSDVMAPLWEKVEPVANEPFEMTPRRIADSSNWITEKFKTLLKGG